ncbi:hypothetical protein KAS08_01365 [Candidatus Pacearchaeota archaeon]|nr:hypothetical protein [Candidatus Pacearchaeota archaeon]
MAKKKSGKEKTYVITAAQGIQNPYSARMYGRDTSKGAPNKHLIKNIESYVEENNAELQIHSLVGGNCNEIELHPFFNNRDDVYVESDSKKRNLQNRVKESVKRENYEGRVHKWDENEQIRKLKAEQNIEKAKQREWENNFGDMEDYDSNNEIFDSFSTFDVKSKDCPYNMPMHYFWENVPETDWPLIGKRLNSNIRTANIPLKPQNKQPLNGKEFLTQKFGGGSVIIGSPKRMMIPAAKGASAEYPHLLMTTGACTYPNYNFGDQGYMAKEHHRYGFAVVDVLDDKIFLPRIVPAQKNGTFIDLGIKYVNGKDPERAEVSAIDVGDSHFVEINPKINEANMDMMRYLRPESTFLNDVFAALSVSVHDVKDKIRLARLHRAGLSNLEKELSLTAEYVTENANLVGQWGGKVYIKASNHDDMLYRWLTADGYKNDKENVLTAHKILAQDPSRDNCLEIAMKTFYDLPNNVVFLAPDEDMFVQGYLMSMHGHKGSNGGKGSLKGIEKAVAKSSIAHGHALMRWHDALMAGTSTEVMDYQKGYFSTSMAGNNAIYKGGLAQSIPIIKSQWAPKRVLDFLEKN